MFGWLRDALTSAPSTFANRHLNTPSLFRQQNPKQQDQFSSDDEEINQSNDNSFYHNPYHSSGQMNYASVPQQQYTNEHTYPTYLARQQTIDTTNQTLDDQIHKKLISLQERPQQLQCYAHRQNNYAYRNRTIETATTPSGTPRSSFSCNQNEQKSNNNNEQRSDGDEEEIDDDDDGEDERSTSIETYHGLSGYYSGQYSNVDEQFDFASVVFWYKNVMQSVKRYLPNNQNDIPDERNQFDNHHYPLSSKSPIVSRKIIEKNVLLNNNETESVNPSLSSSKVKWMGAVQTVTQLNQVRKIC